MSKMRIAGPYLDGVFDTKDYDRPMIRKAVDFLGRVREVGVDFKPVQVADDEQTIQDVPVSPGFEKKTGGVSVSPLS
jgi:hypothetical protein